MIYFVDEDVNQVRPFVTELKLRKYEVEIIPDADTAYVKLTSVNDIDLVMFDVMLATSYIDGNSTTHLKKT